MMSHNDYMIRQIWEAKNTAFRSEELNSYLKSEYLKTVIPKLYKK